jgi:hypothetical protein
MNMLRIKVSTVVTLLLALEMSAAFERSNDLTFRFRDETAPAGGTVQMKLEDTDGTPISGGRPSFAFDAGVFDAVTGIGVFAPTGEAAGAAVIDGNRVTIAYVTTTPVTGDYPIMTVALRLRQDAAKGSRTQFGLNPSSIWTVDGRVVRPRISPGTVTVGGSVAISNVVPGDGWFPAGTVVSVHGVGFNSGSRLRVEDISITGVRFVSSTEMRFTLREAANLTAARLRVDNPDLSRATYYSYIRGVAAATSDRALLSTTQPFFSGTKRSLATVGPIPAMNGAQYAALALQNPGLASANVTLELVDSDDTVLHSSTRSLQNGYRLALELSELFDGMAPPPGAFVRVISSLPIQVFGLLCDEGAWTITPWLPAEAASDPDAASDSRE